MSITVDATYEGGVLMPARPLPLAERLEAGLGVSARKAAKKPDLDREFSKKFEKLARLGM